MKESVRDKESIFTGGKAEHLSIFRFFVNVFQPKVTLSFEAQLIAYWLTVYVHARSIGYATNFSTVVKKKLRKLQRITRVL